MALLLNNQNQLCKYELLLYIVILYLLNRYFKSLSKQANSINSYVAFTYNASHKNCNIDTIGIKTAFFLFEKTSKAYRFMTRDLSFIKMI